MIPGSEAPYHVISQFADLPRENIKECRMKQNIIEKILISRLKEGEFIKGQEIGIRIDQTLTQDATGTMAYLQFEAMGLKEIKTDLSVSYVDHNTVQAGFENADDHKYLQTVAARYGIVYSRPGNGICHQVHLERFGKPGTTLLGSDSHTPTGGGLGMLAIGAGGLEVALAMAGVPFALAWPKVMRINLNGKLPAWVSAKDIILKVLSLLTSKGNVGWIIEYGGSGLPFLSVPERATITNMGAELGVTTSVFPSDKVTRGWLTAQESKKNRRKMEKNLLRYAIMAYSASSSVPKREISYEFKAQRSAEKTGVLSGIKEDSSSAAPKKEEKEEKAENAAGLASLF